MGVCVERLPGESIVIATVRGPLTVDTLRTMFIRTAELTRDIDGPIYRIGDFLDANASFKSMASVITETTRLRPYGTRDPRIHPVLVCGHNRLRFLPELLQRKEFGRVAMPVFDQLEDALSYAREQLGVPLQLAAV